MAALADSAKELIESGALAHLVTVNADGSPQVSIVWVGAPGDELVTAHLDARMRKLVNIRRDPRVVLSFEAATSNPIGMRDSLVVHATAVITEGGAPQLLQRLAQTYVGVGTRFPADARPAAGLHAAPPASTASAAKARGWVTPNGTREPNLAPVTCLRSLSAPARSTLAPRG